MKSHYAFLLAALLGAVPALPAQDYGYEGLAYPNCGLGTPSESKPESKLWFNDGFWWGSLWRDPSLAYRIHRLDTATHTWIDTGVTIDTRKSSVQDALWDGTKLYLASHEFGDVLSGKPSRLYRYSYNGGTYQLDGGFPANINNYRVETVVIAKDSTGTLWATWTQSNKVYINHTLGSDSQWATPVLLPVTTNLNVDDISGVIHFNGDRIGVLWSDQVSFKFWFSTHLDGDPAGAWSPREEAPIGAFKSDDHLNLKTTSDGTVYAAVKTSTNEILLLVRQISGAWSYQVMGTAADSFTRPIILLNEEVGKIYLFASYAQSGGTIARKSSDLSTLSFESGRGTPVMLDAEMLHMNNPSSTKQNVSSATGIVVLGSNQDTRRYWHHEEVLLAPAAPTASFSATPASGVAPLSVNFTDTSAGSPTGWLWDFGDGDTSTSQNPAHAYASPGVYTVSLTATNALGSDLATQPDLIQVEVPPPVLTFPASEDAYVKSSSPTGKYGTATTVRVRFVSSEVVRTYLKFNVTAGPGPVVGAKLHLYVTDGSPDGGSVYAADSTWSEAALTWNTAPPITGSPLASLGPVTALTWVQVDVSAAISGPGTYTLALANSNSNSAYYSSREGGNPPLLEVTYQEAAPVPPTASFTTSATSGFAPLTVDFSDTSTGFPTDWLWDFGDGESSSEQNPSHAYAVPGIYAVTLTESNALGSDTIAFPDLINVQPAPSVLTFPAAEDSFVKSSSPSSKYGTQPTVRVRFYTTEIIHTYLKFNVTEGPGPVIGATLRLNVTDGSPDGGSVYVVDNSWSESTITWSNAPPISGNPVGSLGAVTALTNVELDLSSVITAPGTYSLAIANLNSNSAYYSSREGLDPPAMEIHYQQ